MPLINSRYLISIILRCSAGLLLLSGAASAQTETFKSTGLLGATNQPDSIALPSFQTSLGTLESIVISMQFNICPVIAVDNATSAPLSFTGLSISAPFSVSGPGLTYNATLSTQTISGTAAPGTTDYVPNVGWIYAVKTVSTNNFLLWEDSPGGTISLDVTPGTLVTKGTASLPAGASATSTALEWQNISVQYKYASAAAVPEPSGKYLSYLVGAIMLSVFVGRRLRLGA